MTGLGGPIACPLKSFTSLMSVRLLNAIRESWRPLLFSFLFPEFSISCLIEGLFTDKGFQVEHPDKMPLSSKRYNEAVALLHRMSDRQHAFHVCRGDGNNSNYCWCRINTATTQFPHSHIDTGHVCREPFCEMHTQFSRSQLDLGQCALFKR